LDEIDFWGKNRLFDPSATLNLMNTDDREISRRVDLVLSGKRDPQKDYTDASENVKRAHTAFKASRDKAQMPSAHASEQYAKALRDLDIAFRVLQHTVSLKETA
jgi:hypothetical protein